MNGAAGNGMAETWWLCVAFGVLIVLCIWGMVTFWRRALVIADTPTARVRSAAQGYVELRGQARVAHEEQLRAPLTGRRCLWYRFKVERLDKDCGSCADADEEGSGQASRWVTVRQGCSDESLLLVDATGQCEIFPKGAAVTVSTRDHWSGDSERSPRPRREGGLMATLSALFANPTWRFTEERIHDGNLLYAIGWFRSMNPGDEISLAAETRVALSAQKSDRAALLRRFDRDGDGDIDAAEWAAVRTAVADEVSMARARRSATVVHTLRTPPHRRQQFLLSTRPQRELVQRYRLGALTCGLAAFAFAMFTGVMVTAH